MGSVSFGVLQVLYTSLTAHLVSPGNYGIYSAAVIFGNIIGFLSLTSIGSTLARTPTLDPRLIGSAWLLALAAGVVTAGLAMLAAPLWSALIHVPADGTIRLVAVSLFLAPLAAVPVGILRQRLSFRAVTAVELSAQLVGFLMAALAVIVWRSAWSLVVLPIATSGATLVFAAIATRHQAIGRPTRSFVNLILRFSLTLSGMGLTMAAMWLIPPILVGRTLGVEGLGQFNRAWTLIMVPVSILSISMSRPLYSGLAHAETRAAKRAAITDAEILNSGVTWLLFAVVAAVSPLLLPIILGPGWGPAIAAVPLMCVLGALVLSVAIIRDSMESLGMLKVLWIVVAIGFTATILAMGMAWHFFPTVQGFIGMAIVAPLAMQALQLWACIRSRFIAGRRLLRAYLIHLTTAIVLVLLTRLLLFETHSLDLRYQLLLQALLLAILSVGLWKIRSAFPAWVVASKRDMIPARLRGSS